jgi:putative ABC transport system permease protein
MRFADGILLALSQIRTQKLKSFFAVIGVLIGAMFLMTVVSVVEGMNRYMQDDFARLVFGLNTVSVHRTPSVNTGPPSDEQLREWRSRPRLYVSDADAIRQELETPALVAVSSEGGGDVRADDGTQIENVRLIAASADYFRIRQYEVAQGRLFTQLEDERGVPVVVLGSETASTLFGARDPLGRWVRIDNGRYRVIGVLKSLGSLFGASLDNLAVAPSRSPLADQINPHDVVDEILVRTPDESTLGLAKIETEAIMRRRHQLRPTQADNFALETADDSMSFWTRISRIMFIAFPGLVAIALVVGGMVVMNIMLVSVTERTREIGLRKAVGARRADILLQIIVESATLSLSGAAMGIGLGILLAEVVRAVSPLPAAIAPAWMAVAALIGTVVGILAGVYPASRASRMDPVVALRHE